MSIIIKSQKVPNGIVISIIPKMFYNKGSSALHKKCFIKQKLNSYTGKVKIKTKQGSSSVQLIGPACQAISRVRAALAFLVASPCIMRLWLFDLGLDHSVPKIERAYG